MGDLEQYDSIMNILSANWSIATCISGISLATGVKCSESLFRMFVPQMLHFYGRKFHGFESGNMLISLLLLIAKEF